MHLWKKWLSWPSVEKSNLQNIELQPMKCNNFQRNIFINLHLPKSTLVCLLLRSFLCSLFLRYLDLFLACSNLFQTLPFQSPLLVCPSIAITETYGTAGQTTPSIATEKAALCFATTKIILFLMNLKLRRFSYEYVGILSMNFGFIL